MSSKLSLGWVVLVATTVPLQAQDAPRFHQAPRLELDQLQRGLDDWRSLHGSRWNVFADADSGYAELVYGGSDRSWGEASDPESLRSMARAVLSEARELHGVELESLKLSRTLHLPMAQAGTIDKYTVEFEQEISGIPVVGTSMNVLFDHAGRLLSIQSLAMPNLAELELQPSLSGTEARRIARAEFESETGLAPTREGDARLVFEQVIVGERKLARLAWQLSLSWSQEESFPEGFTYSIDAHSGRVLRARRDVHAFDVSGTVSSLLTPGTAPDTGSNPEISVPMRYLDVTSSQGDLVTDENGNFNYPGVNSPLNVTVRYDGTFNNVDNVAGSEYTTTVQLQPNQANTITMNPSSSAFSTAQANAFHNVNLMRDWIRSINPTDSTCDFVVRSNTNLNQSCNAFYNGSSINFFRQIGNCVNTSYSTIVAHELGHWLNDRYGTGNGSSGMGEGNADVFAMYLYDTPIVGEGFCGSSCSVRSGNNNRQFCGDFNASCYGEVHRDGEPWMGAAWKVRDRLNTTHGDVTGDLIADTIFLGWMNAYNQSGIRSVIETQWLTLDDDDANLNNGTPNYADIDAGFVAQGFPGFALQLVTITGVNSLADTVVEAGPYPVNATVEAHLTPPLSSVELFYRVNGGAFQTRTMVPQNGSSYTTTIPVVVAPSYVEYYIRAVDSGAFTAFNPGTAPSNLMSFRVGTAQTFSLHDFESSNDQGWTHGSFGTTTNPLDEWERGYPTGLSGTASGNTPEFIPWRDPKGPFEGDTAWGIDIGESATDGSYERDTYAWLRSPPIDCSGKVGTLLSYQRWLSVHKYDEATLFVNGNEVWGNSFTHHLLDNSWVVHEVDIARWADGNPSVVLEWRLRTNENFHLGGWTLDVVELSELGSAGSECLTPTSYGAAKQNSNGHYAELNHEGSSSVAANDLVITMTSASFNQIAVLFYGEGPAEIPFNGGTLLVAPPVVRQRTFVISPIGDAYLSMNSTAGLVGTTRFYQVFYRDPPNTDGTGVGLSNALRVDYCP